MKSPPHHTLSWRVKPSIRVLFINKRVGQKGTSQWNYLILLSLFEKDFKLNYPYFYVFVLSPKRLDSFGFILNKWKRFFFFFPQAFNSFSFIWENCSIQIIEFGHILCFSLMVFEFILQWCLVRGRGIQIPLKACAFVRSCYKNKNN